MENGHMSSAELKTRLAAFVEDEFRRVKLDPPASGQTRWLGSRTLVFKPDRRLPFATSFQVTVPAGTRALDSSYLKDDYIWTRAVGKCTTKRIDILIGYRDSLSKRFKSQNRCTLQQ
jgi:hypothetical protein